MIHPWNAVLYGQLTADRAHMPHALLLHGMRGIGKMDLATEIAKSMLCESSTEGQACNVCDACNWFEQGNHPDFRRVEPLEVESDDGESDKPADKSTVTSSEKPAKATKAAKRNNPLIKVEAVREITQFLSLSAHRGGWRVALIHPVEAMNLAAANALLKTLEEPPSRVLLILVTHQIGRLLPTIVSRCRKVNVPLPAPDLALQWLQQADTNLGTVEANALLAESGGAPLSALAFSDLERSTKREQFLDFLAQVTEAKQPDVCQLAQAYKDSHVETWNWLLRWVHDILGQKLTGSARYYLARADQTARAGRYVDVAALLSFQRDLMQAARWLSHPLQTQLLLESWLIRYAQIVGVRA